MNLWRQRVLLTCLSLTFLILGGSAVANAESPQSSSSNYGVGEVFFGTGGQLGTPGNGCSTNYCARASVGEETVGNPSSPNYQARAGFQTTDFPTLEFIVNSGTVNLGTLSTATTGEGTTTFSVLDYVSTGYIVVLEGTTPGNPIPGGTTHYLSPITSAANSSINHEQFGINLVANNVATAIPSTTFGTAVQQIPDSTFGFGQPASGYNTANKFQFNDGDTIASSSKASGESLYTMSMIANISAATPGGSYTGNMSLVVVATF